MGKIQTPETKTDTKSSVKQSSEDLGKRATNKDVIDLLSDDPNTNIRREDTSLTEDDLKLTNEAVRLVQIKRLLDIDAEDHDHDKEIKKILAWARKSGIKNRNQLVAKIKEINYKLGSHDTRTNLRKIHEYVVYDDQIKSLVNKQEMLKHGS